jgi:hypothetical protein
MLRRTISLIASGVLLSAAVSVPMARAQTNHDAQANDKVRAQVQKAGVGRKARVEVRMRDNTRSKGYVSATQDDSFTLTDTKTGATQTIAYADVNEVKRKGGGISTGTWIIIGSAAAAAVIVGVTVIKPILCDGC